MTADRLPRYAIGAALAAVLGLLLYAIYEANRDLEIVQPTVAAPPTTAAAPPTPDWQIAAVAINAGLNDLFMNRDPAKVSQFVDPACPCFAEIQGRLTKLAKDGQKYDKATAILTGSRLVERSADDKALVTVTLRSPSPRLVDSKGTVIDTEDATVGQTNYLITRGQDGTWRLLDRKPAEKAAVTAS